MSEIGPLTMKLVSMEEKKNFLSMYMSHRMELMSNGIEMEDTGRDDQLSRFWNEPDSNYLLWITEGSKKVGFAAIYVIDHEKGKFLDMGIFRDMRRKGYGKAAVKEVCKFARYRGLNRLDITVKKAPDGIVELFRSAGFKHMDGGLYIDL